MIETEIFQREPENNIYKVKSNETFRKKPPKANLNDENVNMKRRDNL